MGLYKKKANVKYDTFNSTVSIATSYGQGEVFNVQQLY
jgi:hypothetical protein